MAPEAISTTKSITFSSVKSFNFRGHIDIQSYLIISNQMGQHGYKLRDIWIFEIPRVKYSKYKWLGLTYHFYHCIWDIKYLRFRTLTVLCYCRESSRPSSSIGFTMIKRRDAQYTILSFSIFSKHVVPVNKQLTSQVKTVLANKYQYALLVFCFWRWLCCSVVFLAIP